MYTLFFIHFHDFILFKVYIYYIKCLKASTFILEKRKIFTIKQKSTMFFFLFKVNLLIKKCLNNFALILFFSFFLYSIHYSNLYFNSIHRNIYKYTFIVCMYEEKKRWKESYFIYYLYVHIYLHNIQINKKKTWISVLLGWSFFLHIL